MDEAFKRQAAEWFERGRHDIETAQLLYDERGYTDSILSPRIKCGAGSHLLPPGRRKSERERVKKEKGAGYFKRGSSG